MGALLQKGKEFLNTLACNAIKTNKFILYIVGGYFLLVIGIILLWLGFWLYQSLYLHKIDLSILLQFINTLITPTMIGFITFIVGLSIDTNGDNIPDEFEEKDKEQIPGPRR